MMWSNWTDVTLILHAVALFLMGIMVLNAARVSHGPRWHQAWPPVLLTAWGVAVLADGVIYLRRWLALELDIQVVRYGGFVSFVLNTISLVAIALLIWRIWKGDIPSGETRNARDQRQEATQEVLDETSFVLAKRGKKLSDAGIDLDERIIQLGEDQRVHDAEGVRQAATDVRQDTWDADHDQRKSGGDVPLRAGGASQPHNARSGMTRLYVHFRDRIHTPSAGASATSPGVAPNDRSVRSPFPALI